MLFRTRARQFSFRVWAASGLLVAMLLLSIGSASMQGASQGGSTSSPSDPPIAEVPMKAPTGGAIIQAPGPVVPAKAWLGAYTQDPDFTNVSGATLVAEVPAASVLPAEDQVLANEVVVPVNGTYDLALTLDDENLSITFGNNTFSLQGTYPAVLLYNSTTILGGWEGVSPLTGGEVAALSIQHDAASPWWWTILLNGAPVTGWMNQAGSSTNGTVLLGVPAFWGERASTFWAFPSGETNVGGAESPLLSTDQPMLAFFGNVSKYLGNSTITLQSSGGSGFPRDGFAWHDFAQDEVLLGDQQRSSVPPGAVLVGNGTLFGQASPLTNGTALWSAPAGPTISSFTAAPSVVTVWQSTQLTLTASGGSGSLSYAYTGLPASCPSVDSNQFTCVPATAGNYTVVGYVNDSLHRTASASLTLQVTPASPPSITSFLATPSTVYAGNTTYLNVSASGGLNPLAYTYVGLPADCKSSDTASLRCAPAAAGSFVVRVYVNDSDGHSVNATTGLTVDAVSLVAASVSPSQDTVGTLGTAQFQAVLDCSAGLPCPAGASYAWKVDNDLGNVSPTSGSSTTFTAGATPGTSLVELTATLGGSLRTASALVTISASPPPTLTAVAVSPGSDTLAVGGSATFTATPACTATCPLSVTYGWSLSNDLGKLSSTGGDEIEFTAGTATGTDALFVNATLNEVTQMSATVLITIAPSVGVLTSVSVSPSVATLNVGSTQVFDASAICSPSPCPAGVSYGWTPENGATGNVTPNSGASTTFTAGIHPGSYFLSVLAILNSVVKSAFVNLTITSTSTLASVTLTPQSASVATGGSQSFTATPTCSSPCPSSVTFTWSLANALGSLSSTSGTSSTFTAGGSPGTVVLTVTATSNGASRSANATITITSGSTPSSTVFGLPDTTLAAIVVVVVVAIVLLVSLLRRKKRREPSQSSPPPGEPPSSSAPATPTEDPTLPPPPPPPPPLP